MSVRLLRLLGGREAAAPAPAPATVARERLQILLAHERGLLGQQPDLLSKLREEILAAVSRHVATRLLSGWTGEKTSRLSKSISSSPTGSNRRSRPRAEPNLPRREDAVFM